jgi:hypothetical protein
MWSDWEYAKWGIFNQAGGVALIERDSIREALEARASRFQSRHVKLPIGF